MVLEMGKRWGWWSGTRMDLELEPLWEKLMEML